ncbi:MAG: protein kinase domain-containing protein [Candidatus Sumerlaeaceae bacterium]
MRLKDHSLCRRIPVIVFTAGLLAVGCSCRAAALSVNSRKVQLGESNPVCAWDIDADGTCELLLTDHGGKMGIYDPKTLKPIWEHQVADKAITSPAVGDFGGTGAYLVAVGAADGCVYVVRPGTGELVAKSTPGPAIVLPPTVVPLGKLEQAGDGIAVADDSGAIRLLRLKGSELTEIFAVGSNLDVSNRGYSNTTGRCAVPLGCADVDGDGVPELLGGTVTGMLQAIPINDPSKRYLYTVSQGRSMQTSICVGDIMGAGNPNVIVGTGNDLYVLSQGASQRMDFREERTVTVNGAAKGQAILGPFLPDGKNCLVGSSENTLVSFATTQLNGETQLLPRLTFANPAARLSPLSVCKLANGSYAAIVVDEQGTIWVLDPAKSGDEGLKYRGATGVEGVVPVGNLTGSGKLEIAYYNKANGTLNVAKLETDVTKDAAPTFTMGVSFQRDGQYGPVLDQRIAAAKTRFESAFTNTLAQFEAAMSAGKTAEATKISAELLGMRPFDEKAQKAYSRLHWKGNFFRTLMFIIVGIAVLAGAGYAAMMVLRKRKAAQRLASLTTSSDYDSAIPELEHLAAQKPHDNELALKLADMYVTAGRYTPQSIPILQKVRAAHPEESRYTLALAQAYANEGDESDEALDTYHVALATLESGRGPIAFRAGNALRRRNDLDNAIKYYKLALKEGYVQPELTRNLAHAFVGAGQFSEKNLPVLEAAYKNQPEDARLLEGLCRCYAAARISDNRACVAAKRLLQHKPDSQVGLRLLAKCELLAGDCASALEHAEKARIATPDDEELLLLLAQCYVVSSRSDDNAVEVLQRVIKTASSAESAEFVKALARAYVARGSSDDEAFEILKRAARENPQDEEIVGGLAKTAESRGDSATVVICLEQSVKLGRQTPEVYQRLANAYAAQGSSTPESERAYREALKNNPDDLTYLRALGYTMLRQDRMDAEAVLALERLLQKETTSLDLGVHLARAYMRNSRFDDAARIANYLLQHAPDNDDLKKLLAQASLQTNRLDDAIAQYEQLYKNKPEDVEATLNLAEAYAQKQRVDDAAVILYEKALEKDPDRGAVRVLLARHHAGAGRYARGLEEYRRAVTSDKRAAGQIKDDLRAHIASSPDRPDLRWMLAELLIEGNNLTEAIEQLDGIFELDPSQGKPVLQALDRILAKDPTNLLGNLRKGVLLKAQGRYEEARPYLERAHAANAGNAEAADELRDLYDTLLHENDDVKLRFELGKVHYALQDYDNAIGQFQKTAQDFRYENESIKMLGLCFVGKGMLEFALTEFKKLVIDDDMKEIMYDLAQRYEAKNDIVGAKQVYRELFRADINYKDVKRKFDMLAGNTSDPMALERTSLMTQLSEKARRRYELVEELGRGAMGIVYKARDNELDEFVALKILPDNLSQNPEAVQRFRSEARSARRLSHPNIVRIHDIGEEMGRKYISMEFVQGGDLKQHFRGTRKGKLLPEEIAKLMAPVANALDYAHSLHIVHRDIKPANIMLDEFGVPKVSDFGIAKMLEKTSETMVGAIIGTPLYMSPEQVQGLGVDNRADIYALGIMMYEFANGRPPFTEGDLAYQHIHVMPKPIEGIPDSLNEIIMRCLEKDRDQRWANAGEIQKAFEQSGLMN